MSSERTLLDESRITRRHVLQAFGVLGGLSLVMGAMDAWGLMGASAAQRPALQGPRDGYAGHRAGCPASPGSWWDTSSASGATTSRCSRRASG